MESVNLENAELRGINILTSRSDNTNLQSANLGSAYISDGVVLNRVDLINANLIGAYLQAYMRDVNLSYARLLGVTGILGANVNEELAIQQLQSEGVIFVSTTLPDGRIYTGHSPLV